MQTKQKGLKWIRQRKQNWKFV